MSKKEQKNTHPAPLAQGIIDEANKYGISPENMELILLDTKFSLSGDEFTVNDYSRLIDLNRTVKDCQMKAGSLARVIAGALAEVADKKLWKINYKNFEEYCLSEHDIAKSTASEAINTYKRFKAADGYYISDKYSEVPWRSLISMRKLSDDEIERLKLLQCKTSMEVKARVKAYGLLSDKLAPNWTNEDFETLWLEYIKENERKALDKITENAEKKDAEEKDNAGSTENTAQNTSESAQDEETAPSEGSAPEPAVEEMYSTLYYPVEGKTVVDAIREVTEMIKSNWKGIQNGEIRIEIM